MRLISFKKYLVILVSVWLVIVLAGLIFSKSMQGKIIDILSEQTGKHLTTEIHIRKSNIHFSVFKKFPHASVELRNVCFKVPASVNLNNCTPLKGDTLLFAKSLYLQLNLKSLLKKNYELEKISVKEGFIQILLDNQGNSSLEIIREKETVDTASFITNINSLSINNLTIFTSDINNQSQTETFVNHGTASGVFSGQNFSIKIKTNGKIVKYSAKGQELMPQQIFAIDTDIKYSNKRYTIKRGAFKLSNIPFTVIGNVTPGKNTLVDLIFSAKSVPLKQIDKAILRGLLGESGFEPKGGNLNIQSTFIGYTGYKLPAIKTSFTVRNGKVFDSHRKLLYEDIYITGNADNGKKRLPKTTTIRIDSFALRIGSSKQYGKLKIQNLIQPSLYVNMKGNIDVTNVKGLITIPDITINEGTMRNNIAISGTIIKDLEKDNNILDNLKIWGDLSIDKLGIFFENYKIPYATITGDIRMDKSFSLQFDSLKVKSGHSDISISGKLSHFLKKDGIPTFRGNVFSDYFLADDFITPSTSTTTRSRNVNFPDSVIVEGSLTMKEFTFGKFITSNVKGNILYRNKKLTLNPYSMDGFEGSLRGELSISQNPAGNVKMTTNGTLNHLNIKKLFDGCNNFSQDIINTEHLGGKISGNVSFSSVWTNKLELIPSELINQSNIVIIDGELINYQPLMGLSRFIDVEELSHIKFEKLVTGISIHNEKVFLDQTTIASSAITFDGSGVHGFDNKYEYRLQLGLSDILWRKAKKKRNKITEFGYVVDDGVGHTVLPLVLSGKGTSFDVKYDRKTARKSFRKKLSEEKKELKELFNSKDTAKELEPEPILIEHSEEEEITKKNINKTDSGAYKVQSKEHTIIWDDSPDEEEDSL